MIEIVVTDSGSGIDQIEGNEVTTGNETPLEQGSGLGLWFVTRDGGSFQISARAPNDTHGTTVTVRLPAIGETRQITEIPTANSPVSVTRRRLHSPYSLETAERCLRVAVEWRRRWLRSRFDSLSEAMQCELGECSGEVDDTSQSSPAKRPSGTIDNRRTGRMEIIGHIVRAHLGPRSIGVQ